MKNRNIKRKVKVIKDTKQWKMHYSIARFAEQIDKLPDAGEVQRNKLTGAPMELVEMVF